MARNSVVDLLDESPAQGRRPASQPAASAEPNGRGAAAMPAQLPRVAHRRTAPPIAPVATFDLCLDTPHSPAAHRQRARSRRQRDEEVDELLASAVVHPAGSSIMQHARTSSPSIAGAAREHDSGARPSTQQPGAGGTQARHGSRQDDQPAVAAQAAAQQLQPLAAPDNGDAAGRSQARQRKRRRDREGVDCPAHATAPEAERLAAGPAMDAATAASAALAGGSAAEGEGVPTLQCEICNAQCPLSEDLECEPGVAFMCNSCLWQWGEHGGGGAAVEPADTGPIAQPAPKASAPRAIEWPEDVDKVCALFDRRPRARICSVGLCACTARSKLRSDCP